MFSSMDMKIAKIRLTSTKILGNTCIASMIKLDHNLISGRKCQTPENAQRKFKMRQPFNFDFRFLRENWL